MNASRLTEQRKAGKISQEEFFIRLNKLRLANSVRACGARLEVHPTSETQPPKPEALHLHQENEDQVPDLGGVVTAISDSNNIDPEGPACGLRQDGERRPSRDPRVTESGEYRQQYENASKPSAGHSDPSTPPRITRKSSAKHGAPVLGNASESGSSSERIKLLLNPGPTHERTTAPRLAADCSVSTTRGPPPTGGKRCLQNPDSPTNGEESTSLPVRSPGGESALPAIMRESSPSWRPAGININVEEYTRVAWVGLSPRGGTRNYFSARDFLYHPTDVQPRVTSIQSLRQPGPRSENQLCVRSNAKNVWPKWQRQLPCGNVISLEDQPIRHQAERERPLLTEDSGEPEGGTRVASQRPRTSDSASRNAVSDPENRSTDASTSRREPRVRRDSWCNTGPPRSLPPYPRSQQGYAKQDNLGADCLSPSVPEQASSRSAICTPPWPTPMPMNDQHRRHRSDGEHDAEFANHEDKNGTSSIPVTSGTLFFDESQPKEPPRPNGLHAVTDRAWNKRAPGSLYERTTEWRARVSEARARKLAFLEQRELDTCTFQPNARPHPSGPNRASVSGVPGRAQGDEGHRAHQSHRNDGERDGCLRPSGGSAAGAGARQRAGKASDACQRLFEGSERLRQRKREREERRQMGEEEAFSRNYTFQPSLARGSAHHHMEGVRARFRNAAAVPPPPDKNASESVFPYRPKILGVRPEMTRALEYINLEVSSRLYGAVHRASCGRSIADAPPRSESRGGVLKELEPGKEPGRNVWGDCGDDRENSPCHDIIGSSRGSLSTGEGSEQLSNRSRQERGRHGGRDVERSCDARPLKVDHRDGSDAALGDTRVSRTAASSSSRPRSAPARAGFCGSRDDQGHLREQSQGSTGSVHARRERSSRGARSKRTVHRVVGERPRRRQEIITFSEFLARQAHSQELAKQHLRRLTRLYSPSFTPKLSPASLRMVTKNRARAGIAGGGSFEARLKMTMRRRQRNQKAAMEAASQAEDQECTFSPALTSRAKGARSRSPRELSIGDAALREAKQRLAKLREETRLLESREGETTQGCGLFAPRLETARDALAPRVSSGLRLADELDTYLDRLEEAAIRRDETLRERRQQTLVDEACACTFQPSLTTCPELVKRTAEGMRRIREFRWKEALLSSSAEPQAPAKPRWRW